MNKSCIIKITLFLLISSICLGGLAYLLGAFYFPEPSESTSVTDNAEGYTTVIIDAGHGGEDGGTSSASGLIEKNVNLDIANMLCEMLKASGVNTIMTRKDDRLLYDRNTDYQGRKKKLDHAARLLVMKNQKNAIFISIHMNAYTDSKYSGLQVWYSQNYQDSLYLADTIQKNNRMLLQPNNKRRIKAASGDIFLLNEATCPAVLVECGFLSNQAEAALFETEKYRKNIALMLFISISDFLQKKD